MTKPLSTLLVLAALAGAGSVRAQAPDRIVPVVDHHLHLVSPALAAFVTEPPLPAAEVPAELLAALREREQHFGKAAELAELFTEDAVVLDATGPQWIRGRAAIGRYVADVFSRPYRVTPVAWQGDGTSATVAAYLTRGEGAEMRIVAHSLLEMKKGADGRWRVWSETDRPGGPPDFPALDGDQLVRQLDDAGIRRGLVLSVAYVFGDPRRQVQDEYAKVRAENDWVAAQVQRHPDRLRAFCSFNPLRDYALRELERCASNPVFRGIKLHVGNSGIDLTNAGDLAKLRDVFAAADRHRLPIVIHLRTFGHPYGRAAAEGFLRTVLPAAPDIPVQIAHLAGSGPGYEDPPSDSALQVFADAISRGDPRTRHLLFDVATMVDAHISPATAARVAARIRQIGPERILWGSDLAARGNPTPREGWAYFRGLLPLTEAEFATIARNVAPYMR